MQLQSYRFNSLLQLDREGLPELFTTTIRKVRFLDFPAKPLGIPCEILQTPKNGACFPSAISWALTGCHTAAPSIRKLFCDYIADHPELYKMLTGDNMLEDFEKYITQIRKSNAYADYLEIAATSRVFNINIFVFTRSKDARYWNAIIPPEINGVSRGNVYIMLFESHFTLVLNVSPVDDKDVVGQITAPPNKSEIVLRNSPEPEVHNTPSTENVVGQITAPPNKSEIVLRNSPEPEVQNTPCTEDIVNEDNISTEDIVNEDNIFTEDIVNEVEDSQKSTSPQLEVANKHANKCAEDIISAFSAVPENDIFSTSNILDEVERELLCLCNYTTKIFTPIVNLLLYTQF